MRLERIPKKLLVIGGGVIGLEFATVYARLGAQVLVVEMMPQILTGTDLEIGKTLGRILKKQGIEIMLNTKVGAIEKHGKTASRDAQRRRHRRKRRNPRVRHGARRGRAASRHR